MMGAAMRVKACVTLVRFRRDASDEQRGGAARRSRFEASLKRRASTTILLMVLVVAASLSAVMMSGLVTQAHGLAANSAAAASHDCSARYAALLDLAELARRDGKSSEVVVRGLSDRAGAMSECLPVRHAAQTPQ